MRIAGRKLMWFTLGFAAAMSCGISVLWNHPIPLYAGVFLIAAVMIGILFRRHSWMLLVLEILLGVGAGFAWLSWMQISSFFPLTDLDGQTVPLQITATTYSEQAQYSMTFDGTTEINGKRYPVRVYLKEDREVAPGDVLDSTFRIRLTTPNGLKESGYYQSNRIFLLATQKGDMLQTTAPSLTVWTLPVYVARQVKQLIHTCFPERTAPFAQALFLGDTSELPYETDTALKISGIRHIVAVSGLHISILFELMYSQLGRRRLWTPLLVTAVLVFFAAMTGFTPSVTRACIMACLSVFSLTASGSYDAPTGLAAACLGMMMFNPFVTNSVSFQLSVSSVAGILLFSNPLKQWIRSKLPEGGKRTRLWWNRLAAAFSVSISAMLLSTPFTVYYFGTISLAALLTNLLTIWCVGIIFCGTGLVCALGWFSATLGSWIAWLVSGFIDYVVFVAKTIAAFPLAAVYTKSVWILVWVIGSYVLLCAFFLLGKKKPFRYLGLSAAALVLALSLSWGLPKLDDCRMTTMYVGEGQCILLQSKGKSFLVDCGGNYDTTVANVASETLLSQGITKLDGVVLTHFDRDHSGGLPYLLSRISVDRIYLPELEERDVIAEIRKYTETEQIAVQETKTIPLGNAKVTLFGPEDFKTENENCMCVLFDTPKCDILITGDRGFSGEKRLVKQGVVPDVDILVAGHHGSKNSTSEELLTAAQPETVIISAGINNSYGHPASELLERLEAFGCTVRRTDLEGTILIRR